MIGAAWDPLGDKKTVVHASFGQYDVLPLTSLFSLIAVLSAPSTCKVPARRCPADRFRMDFTNHWRRADTRAEFIQQNPKRSYVLQWNFAVQREFAPTVIIEAGYTGSHGHHLPLIENDINTVLPASATSLGYFWPSRSAAARSLGRVGEVSPVCCGRSRPATTR